MKVPSLHLYKYKMYTLYYLIISLIRTFNNIFILNKNLTVLKFYSCFIYKFNWQLLVPANAMKIQEVYLTKFCF